jgi:hypothetical protein
MTTQAFRVVRIGTRKKLWFRPNGVDRLDVAAYKEERG